MVGILKKRKKKKPKPSTRKYNDIPEEPFMH